MADFIKKNHINILNRLVKLSISTGFFTASRIINALLSPFRKDTSDKLVTLSYHSVKAGQRVKFAEQMDRIIQIGKPVFADATNGLSEGNHCIAVTFDDGFSDFIDNAHPAMLARKIPAILFVPSGYLGKTPGWITDRTHENVCERIISVEQLKALPDHMVKIGSHCVTHPRLTSLRKDEIVRELCESKKQLEALLGREINVLSFPYDNYNDDIVKLAMDAGYLHVFKDLPTFRVAKKNSFMLGRISVTPEDWKCEYWLKLKGAYRWLPLAVKMKCICAKTLFRAWPKHETA